MKQITERFQVHIIRDIVVTDFAGAAVRCNNNKGNHMKINNTPEQLSEVETALRKIHVYTFETKSCDAKHNAQQNLSGKTHYVDDDTLRFHKSRIQCSQKLANGLLFYICTSDALDMNGTRRGFRYVVFDVFGTTVFRPDLEGAKPTRDAARKEFEKIEFDVLAHYRDALSHKLQWERDQLKSLEEARNSIYGCPVAA